MAFSWFFCYLLLLFINFLTLNVVENLYRLSCLSLRMLILTILVVKLHFRGASQNPLPFLSQLEFFLEILLVSYQCIVLIISKIWQMLKTMIWYDTCTISWENSHHDRNGSGFCEAPLKFNFTTWMSGLAFRETSKTFFARFQQHSILNN